MILSVAIVISMVLCVPIALDSERAKTSGEISGTSQLTLGFMQSIDSLNPYVGLNDASYLFYGLVYDALTCVGEDLEPVSNLATSYYAVPLSDPEMVGMPYGSIWQYNVSHNAYWTDGEPFTADDVVYNVWLNANVTNYDSMWAYQPYSYFMKEAWKVDDYSVRISFWNRTTDEPEPASYAYLLSIPMLPKHLLEMFPMSYIGMNWTGVFNDTMSPGMPIVGTGPFMSTPDIYNEWLAGDQITLVRNPNYHWTVDKGPNYTIKFDQVVLKFFQDATSMVLALKNKDIDAASYAPTAFQSIKDDVDDGTLLNVSYYDGPKINNYFTQVGFCMNKAGPNPSRLDPVIRTALHMATNKQYVVDNFYIGQAEVGTTLIPPVSSWHYEPNSNETIYYDIPGANALLEDNGYIDVDSDGIRECTANSTAVKLGYVSEGKKLIYEMLVRKEVPEEKDIAAYVKDQWAQVGVTVNYVVVEELTLAYTLYSYKYDTVIWYWSADIDPNYILFTQSKTAWNGWSDNKYFNAAFDENYTLSVQTLDPVERETYVDNCQRIFYKDSAYIILAYPNQTYAWRTDTFSGWGDWSAHPGRSLDNIWTGNPLYFDLKPEAYDSPPVIEGMDVNPNPVLPFDDTNITVHARDSDGEALYFYVEFGDGQSASAVGTNTTWTQSAEFVHQYSITGMYDVTVYVNDTYPEDGHNISETFSERVLVGPSSWLGARITPMSITLDIGDRATLSAEMTWVGQPLGNYGGMSYFWRVSPVNLGSFVLRGAKNATFIAGSNWGSGTISCSMLYYGIPMTASASLTVNPPHLSSVTIDPVAATLNPGSVRAFHATAYDSVGGQIASAEFTWSLTGDLDVLASLVPPLGLNATTGSSVTLAVDDVLGLLTLSVNASYGGFNVPGYSNITVGYLPPRSVDYRWYDMFNVPFGSWWWKRYEVYGYERPLTDSYPYILGYDGQPDGNSYYYTGMRLNITGRNLTEINMNSWPEFLPLLGTERGGNAQIDWYMQYLTKDQLNASYGTGIANQDDGWIIDLNGTVTLDEQAAKAVLNVSDSGFDDFTNWWAAHSATVTSGYGDWLYDEAEGRLDIENAYQSYFQLFVLDLNAAKVGGSIVVSYDILTWGMEALMMRWLHDAFLPTEWWYEDMDFHARIGPSSSSFDIDTAVSYAMFADQTTLLTDNSGTSGAPCWRWHGMLGDAVPSSELHPYSDFDPYEPLQYIVHRPGSVRYGQYIDYDYTPGAWNLSDNETLEFTWPAGDQQFKYHVQPGVAANVSSEMTVTYAEPMDYDFPGQISVDETARTITFTGPIDVWDWSRNQSAHEFLSDEWNRLGGILPYGQPLVEFCMKTPVPQHLDHFVIDAVSQVPAGDLVTVTVWALDQYGNVYTDYDGTVNFTSTDVLAVLPANYTFIPGFWDDAGVHTFFGAFIFGTPGAQTLTVTNISMSLPLVSVSKVMTVQPVRTADSMLVDVYHMPTVGVPEDITVWVIDQYGDLFVNYVGTITFDSDRPGDVSLPADYTFLPADEGVHTIVGGVTFSDIGWFMVFANDTSDPSVYGIQWDILVVPDPEVIDHFSVSGVRDMLLRQRSDVTVVAYNQYGMLFERYTGTIHFSVNDTEVVATFPEDYTFTESDEGVRVFDNAVMFDVSEDKVLTVYVADTVVTTAMGQQDNIVIQYVPSSETFRMYDMFQQPWGEWWPWRYKGWTTDIILNNETGKYTMIYNPDKMGRQGVIYAPYRWNITGTNMSSVSISNPEFMPVLGNPNVPGAAASLKVYFEYLDTDWWYGYWSPYWKFPNTIFEDGMKTDGYYLGVVYNVVMNRAAAESWMGMPVTANPYNWWIIHASSYINAWSDWITNEGSVRLDIWAGYEWGYTDMGLKMKMRVLANGDIHLEIGEISWGYEILMTRWLTETQLCNHEPWYEDASLSVTYYPQWSDFTFDAVCQYSLHAVKANESATNEGAWVWEPQLIDYMDSSNGHPSTFDPWATETYQSWNAGDPMFGQEVAYDSGLQYFNLTDYQTFIIQLPLGNDVLGYLAQPVLNIPPKPTAITKIILGKPSNIGHIYDKYPLGDGTNYNYEEYWPLMYNGTMSLGWYGNWTGAPYLDPMYNPATNTIMMVGPMSFDNTHHANGALYRGAPWIEFNVTPVAEDNTPPDAVASASPNPADSGTNVTLDGSLSSDNVGIVDYMWTFVYDGVPQELHGQVVYFTFLTPGSYNITLNCTDAAGNYDTITIELVVNPVIPEFGSLPAVIIVFVAIFMLTRRFRRKDR
jgi:peptide/nickel transport system substrate-binding protein